jgi:hypothetical protein
MSKPKRVVLEGFVEDYPDKAVDILMKCCHEPDIAKEIVDFLLDQRLNATYTISDNNASIAPNPKTSNISQRPGSFSSHRQQPSHSIPGVEAHTDSPSPPTTRSDHSRSLSGKDGKENILILATNEDDDIEKHPATMKLAPIEYSVIGEHMFTAGRICESNIKAIEEEQISVPQRGVPGALRQITVSSRAELTWKRSISNASHRTTFFLVAQEFLDTDLLLGSLDSGEGMYSWPHACTRPGLTYTTHTDRPDMPDTILSPPQQGQGLNFNEHAESHHRSSTMAPRTPLIHSLMKSSNSLQGIDVSKSLFNHDLLQPQHRTSALIRHAIIVLPLLVLHPRVILRSIILARIGSESVAHWAQVHSVFGSI